MRASRGGNTPKLGVMLGQLTPGAAAVPTCRPVSEGVVVTDVQAGQPGGREGLQPGDVIVEADRKQVSDPKAVADAVREAPERGDQAILLLVKREGQNRFVAIGLGARLTRPLGAGRPWEGGRRAVAGPRYFRRSPGRRPCGPLDRH